MTTSIFQVTLDNIITPDLFLFMIMVLVAQFIPLLYYRGGSGRVPEIRKLPQVDILTEFTSAAAEKGRPILVLMAGYKHSGIAALNAYLVITRWIAERCATLKVRMIGTASPGGYTPVGWGERSLLMMQDYARQGYIQAGVPEAFVANDIRFIPNPGANTSQYSVIIMEAIALLKIHKPAVIFVLGNVGNTQPTLWAATDGMDILSLGMTDEGYQCALESIICDSSTDASEMQPVAAYISGDPTLSSGMVASDAQAYLLIIVIIAMIIKTGLGL